jgi:hypothetical protein
MDNEDDLILAKEFYSQVSEIARANGVTVNLITIEGSEDCKIAALTTLCEFTGGQIYRVSPISFEPKFE